MKVKNTVVLQSPNIYGAESYIINDLDITDRPATQSRISEQQHIAAIIGADAAAALARSSTVDNRISASTAG